MANRQDIHEQLEQLRGLEVLTQAYEEIASTRMKKTRDKVLSKREFLSDVNEVFDEVRKSYARQVLKLVRKKGQTRGGKITFLAHNGKTVAVLLSANTGLYGDIVQNTFEKFIKEVREKGSEATIIGRQGLTRFLQEEPNRPYTYFELPDHGATSEQMAGIIKHIVQYEKIHVYFGKFISFINQAPTVFSISAEISLEEEDQKEPKMYIFEPNLEKILMFFETEIFASLFEQTVSESNLAKYASRVMAMDRAAANIENYLKHLELEKLKIEHRTRNRKQLNYLSSVLMRMD
ncbi:MAG: F0F1 ATP synthase subunit gamma [Candidatus Woesebacteria bacterium]|jgi:F-type H+-transporting ATPase subunit gamma